METKYEVLLEHSVRAQEDSNTVSKALLEVSKGLQNNVKELNDQFVLHAQKQSEVYKEVILIRNQLLKWLKILLLLLLGAVGGASLIETLGIDLSNLIK